MRNASFWRLWVLIALALACSAGSAERVRGTTPEGLFAGGAAAYVVEVDGRVQWSHRPEAALAPASLTKLMTALLVLERSSSLDDIVVVSTNAARATGARLKLLAGERLRVRDLLAATLLASANDACLALAEHVAGDKLKFAALMNRRAGELGMSRSHFTNPCGHDEPNHRSSARDLAVLTRAALRQPVLAQMVRSTEQRIVTLAGRRFDVENRNELVGRYPGAIGVKSGFTARAGKCVIALAQRNGISVLLVALDAPNRWWDATAALDRAFATASLAKGAAK